MSLLERTATEGPQSARDTETFPATRWPPTAASCPRKQANTGCRPAREAAHHRNRSNNKLRTHGSQLPAAARRSRPPQAAGRPGRQRVTETVPTTRWPPKPASCPPKLLPLQSNSVPPLMAARWPAGQPAARCRQPKLATAGRQPTTGAGAVTDIRWSLISGSSKHYWFRSILPEASGNRTSPPNVPEGQTHYQEVLSVFCMVPSSVFEDLRTSM